MAGYVHDNVDYYTAKARISQLPAPAMVFIDPSVADRSSGHVPVSTVQRHLSQCASERSRSRSNGATQIIGRFQVSKHCEVKQCSKQQQSEAVLEFHVRAG